MAFNLNNIEKQDISLQQEKEDVSFLKREITVFSKVFSNKTKEEFYIELSVLLKAGVSLRVGLELLLKSQKKKQNKKVLEQIYEAIISGENLSDALHSHKSFTDYEYYSLKIGEETGTLHTVTEQLGAFFVRKNEQRRNLVSALTYPIIILSTAVLVVVFMLRFVVPMFQDIFKQQQVELPTITKWIISLSEFIGDFGWLLFVGLVGLLASKSYLNKNVKFKYFRDRLILKLPFIGNFVKNVYLAQFTQAVSLLTASKVSLVKSIQLVKKMIDFYPLQSALNSVESQVIKGALLSESLRQNAFFDDKMVALVSVSEETNETQYIFDRLNKQYNTQVEQQSKMLSTIMEPLIIVVVGFFVGIILIAMYLPMFKLSSVVG